PDSALRPRSPVVDSPRPPADNLPALPRRQTKAVMRPAPAAEFAICGSLSLQRVAAENSIFSLPPSWGRAGVGGYESATADSHPHSSLPPSSGKEFDLPTARTQFEICVDPNAPWGAAKGIYYPKADPVARHSTGVSRRSTTSNSTGLAV